MSRSAHPAGPRHADVLPEGHYLAPPADPNALDPKVWSRTVTRDEHGMLTVGGIDVKRLAEEFGGEGWPLEARGSDVYGPHGPTAGPPPYAIYRLEPTTVFALPGMHGMFDDDRHHAPTRWAFEPK